VGFWRMMFIVYIYMAMDQYLLIPFLVGWTSIYQLFWGSPGVQGFDTLPYMYSYVYTISLITEIEGNPIDLVLITIFKFIFLWHPHDISHIISPWFAMNSGYLTAHWTSHYIPLHPTYPFYHHYYYYPTNYLNYHIKLINYYKAS